MALQPDKRLGPKGYTEKISSPTVITTTFDGRLPWLKDLIESLLAFTPQAFAMIVIDNGTTDGTGRFLRSLEWVRTVRNDLNLDDTRGVNQALRFAQTDYIVKVDTDTLIGDHGWWEESYCLMEANPKVGIAGDVWNPGFLLPSRMYREGWPEPDRDAPLLDHVQGGFMVLRRRMLDQVGLFNEDYPHLGMDVEISHRALSYGWELGQIPFVNSHCLNVTEVLAGYKVFHPVSDPHLRDRIMKRVRQARAQEATP